MKKPLGRFLLAASMGSLIVFCTGCPVMEGETPVEPFQRTEPATGSKYYLYVPNDYDASKAWPLLVTLHGTHGFDDAHAQVREWKALAEKGGFIVLAPQLDSPQGIMPVLPRARTSDLQKDEQRILNSIDEVKKAYRINDQAVAVSGFSAGGIPMYYVGLRHPEVFEAMIARAANFDVESVKHVPITDQAKKLNVFIFYGKTGINPVSSQMNPLARQAWEAHKYLRQHGVTKEQIKPVEGGHERRPDLAWRYWQGILKRNGQLVTGRS